VNYAFPGETRITGLHIHRGGRADNGPVLIDSGISGTNSVTVDATGRGRIQRQGQTLATNATGLEAVNGVLANPAGYYVNLHTTENPSGVMRGQVERAEMVVLMAPMTPENENPPITGLNATGMASVVALLSRDENGNPTGGSVIFDVNHRGFPEGSTFSGFHIHRGAAGVNGPVTINSGLPTGANAITANPAGGNLHFEVDVPMTNAAAMETLQGLFTNPQNYYINLHTTVNPGGAIRSQMRRTDTIRFPVLMSSANEVPPIAGLDASAPSILTVHTIRNPDGTVAAGTVIFDINYRFPGEAEFTGLHIHDGLADATGGVTINTGVSGNNRVTTQSGSGNIFRIVNVSSGAGLATLNSLVANPQNHYVNLHTAVNPGGAVRAQLAAANTATPVLTSATSAANDAVNTVAPGSLIRITGSNLATVESDVLAAFNGQMLPSAHNGTQVTIGGRTAPVLSVSRGFIVAHVPLDAPRGTQQVSVRNANGTAAATIPVTVSATAPVLFFSPGFGGIFSKNADFSLVTMENAAVAGDIVVAWATGLGVTTPVLQSGQIAPPPGANNTLFNTAPVTVTVGGRAARVLYSIASPGFAGLNQVAFEVPGGAGTGAVPVTLAAGGVTSTPVTINLR
jgi:uncharacterized protein (TIGR03437 family)